MMLELVAPAFILGAATGISMAWTYQSKRKVLFVLLFITFVALSLAATVFKDVGGGSLLWYSISTVMAGTVANLVMWDRSRPYPPDDSSVRQTSHETQIGDVGRRCSITTVSDTD
jgi:hypothetical protein